MLGSFPAGLSRIATSLSCEPKKRKRTRSRSSGFHVVMNW